MPNFGQTLVELWSNFGRTRSATPPSCRGFVRTPPPSLFTAAGRLTKGAFTSCAAAAKLGGWRIWLRMGRLYNKEAACVEGAGTHCARRVHAGGPLAQMLAAHIGVGTPVTRTGVSVALGTVPHCRRAGHRTPPYTRNRRPLLVTAARRPAAALITAVLSPLPRRIDD